MWTHTLLLTAVVLAEPAVPVAGERESIADAARRIIDHQLSRSRAYDWLEELCDDIGHRLSGSPQAEEAVRWGRDRLRSFGLDQVRLQSIMVHKWVRGRPEEIEMVSPRRQTLRGLALGGSVATPIRGIEAEVMAVETFEELMERRDEAQGKIVLFTRSMGPDGSGGTLGYGDVVSQRTAGAIEAARVGAVASLIRSVGTADFRLPHTGMMRYREGVPQIPHAALSSEDSELLSRLLSRGQDVRVRMRMDCRDEGEVPSANVIADWRGRELPEEVVVIGGHLDSWDVGQGAQDDGVGVVACMEALRVLKELDLRPRRTIRVVLFMNEENGLAGGRAYAREHADALESHVAAIEMDGGAFGVRGFGISAGDGGLDRLSFLREPLGRIGADRLTPGGGGADIGPMRASGVPQIGLRSDSTRYFDYHHTEADTLDKVDPLELAKCTAALAVLAYALAEMEEPLPRLR